MISVLSQEVAAGAHCARRRSVDVGGLSLALENNGLGHGWGGWEEEEISASGPRYAELLTEMRTHTLLAVSEHHAESSTPIEMSSATRHRLIDSLDSWNFEPHKLPEEEMLSCALIIFEVLYRIEGMKEEVGVSLDRISSFLRHLRHIYRSQNSYHNFQHALDVLQATHTYLRSAGMVPAVSILHDSDEQVWRPDKNSTQGALVTCLSNVDLFAVYIAAIGHDVGHPGFTNVFMKNAKAALSAVYDDKSALEQMHYLLLLSVLRINGMGHLLDRSEVGTQFRKLLSESVLATDMSVHLAFMERFKTMVEEEDHHSRYSLIARKVLMCQALIKCADISNPSRPHRVSQYWATALMTEWTAQASLERHFHLPPTVQPSDDPLTEAKGQIFFINAFAKPLLDLTCRAIPQMEVYARQCAANLALWEHRCAELTARVHTDVTSAGGADDRKATAPPTMLEDYMTAFPMTLPSVSLLLHEDHAVAPVTWNRTLYTRPEHSSSSSNVSSDSQPRSPTSSAGTAGSSHQDVGSTKHTTTGTPVNSPMSDPTSPSESIRSFMFSTKSEAGAVQGGSSSGTNGAATAIRAAYEASVRKKKSFHRNSWTPDMAPTEAVFVVRPSRLGAALPPAL